MPRARAACKIPLVEGTRVDGSGRTDRVELERGSEVLLEYGMSASRRPWEIAMATEVEAQITGNVWKIEKAVGDRVQEEDVILIIESMKMEIPVEAPCAGRITEIRTSEGESVEEGDVLVVLE